MKSVAPPISEITIGIHRSHAMTKTNAKSLADVVRMAESLGLQQTEKRRQ